MNGLLSVYQQFTQNINTDINKTQTKTNTKENKPGVIMRRFVFSCIFFVFVSIFV